MTDEDLAEWREHPVTKAFRDVLRHSLDRDREHLTLAYLRGQAADEKYRLRWQHQRQMWGDLFESSAEDVRAMMERMQNEDAGV